MKRKLVNEGIIKPEQVAADLSSDRPRRLRPGIVASAAARSEASDAALQRTRELDARVRAKLLGDNF